MAFNPQTARDLTPAFSQGPTSSKEGLVMLENAGGTLPSESVITRMTHHMTYDHVNIGNPSRPSQSADKTLQEARRVAETLLNAAPQGRVLFGPSSTALIYSMVNVMRKELGKGDEVVVFMATHEANVSPWLQLEDAGVRIVKWNLSGDNDYCSVADLRRLVTIRTRYVALPHASNVTGAVSDLTALVKCVREVAPDARVFVDGVAYAAHKLVDTAAWDVDYYVVSTHKLYGPHFACLYAKHAAIDELPRVGLDFLPSHSSAHFEYGTLQFEALAGLIGMKEFFNSLEGRDPEADLTRQSLESLFSKIAVHELELEGMLMSFLLSHPRYKVYSFPHDNSRRVPIVCFKHNSMLPKVLSDKINKKNIIVKHGHFCAPRLLDELQVDREEGLVRVSFSVYNTVEEAQLLCSVLEQIDLQM